MMTASPTRHRLGTALLLALLAAQPAFAQTDTVEPMAGDYLDAADTAELNAEMTVDDPIEGVNRAVHSFNKGFDTVILRPVSKGYEYVVPAAGRRMVFRFMENIESPVIFVNSLLQGDPQNTFVTFWRFVFNSTLGVAGLFDMATELGVPPRRDEDFGQTLGHYGVPGGPYLVLPIFGPSNLRDAPSRVVDWFLQPLSYLDNGWIPVGVAAVDAVDTRSRYGKFIDNTYNASLDPYATFRSLYLQRREAQILNKVGTPPPATAEDPAPKM